MGEEPKVEPKEELREEEEEEEEVLKGLFKVWFSVLSIKRVISSSDSPELSLVSSLVFRSVVFGVDKAMVATTDRFPLPGVAGVNGVEGVEGVGGRVEAVEGVERVENAVASSCCLLSV